jgi:hypothetical protein
MLLRGNPEPKNAKRQVLGEECSQEEDARRETLLGGKSSARNVIRRKS